MKGTPDRRLADGNYFKTGVGNNTIPKEFGQYPLDHFKGVVRRAAKLKETQKQEKKVSGNNG